MVYVINDIYKQMIKLAMENILNIELIRDDPNFFKFMQVHKNEEDKYVILAKEAKRVLSLLNTRNTNNNKRKKIPRFPTLIITFKTYHTSIIKNSTCIGIIGSFLGTQLLQKSSKWEEEILFFRIIITGLIQNLVNVFLRLF